MVFDIVSGPDLLTIKGLRVGQKPRKSSLAVFHLQQEDGSLVGEVAVRLVAAVPSGTAFQLSGYLDGDDESIQVFGIYFPERPSAMRGYLEFTSLLQAEKVDGADKSCDNAPHDGA